MRPCDHHKGLECNYGNDVTMAWGICRGEEGGNSVCECVCECFHPEEGIKAAFYSCLQCSCQLSVNMCGKLILH